MGTSRTAGVQATPSRPSLLGRRLASYAKPAAHWVVKRPDPLIGVVQFSRSVHSVQPPGAGELERTAERGSYALGSGKSVPEYVPAENYAALVWAAVEHRGG